ncbi:uncharacterized protein [Spinacia oleracea]|uniref:Uncharacterized protein n=1 Tax=Spinacia oleracea TaxID=3562 RepID=A0ABM3QYM2_SPIOL|nr:uncharacterized protein LOC130463374 [Spinacia oleracea]
MDSYLYESKYHNCGRKRIQVTYESIASIGMGDRTNIRDLAKMLNLGPTTVWRMVKRKQIKAHSSPLHPGISEECKMTRMRWVLSLIMDYSIPNDPTYYNMYDFIHIDEKWLNLTHKNAVAAKRTSKNRVKGTIETKPIKSVNQIATRAMLINYLIPTIKEKWPPHDGEKPAKSPDCNILDLEFFMSIQSLMHKKMPKTVEDLSGAVIDSFNELHAKTLSNVWMSLQYVGNEILKHKGDNNYQLPHNKKKNLEDEGNLPEQVKAPRWAVNECTQLVEEWKANQ